MKNTASWGWSWRTLCILMVCLLWGGTSADAAKKAWAKFDTTTTTLTFYYTEKGDLGDGEYEMNEGSEAPGWITDHAKEITKAVFDASFANARPKTCHSWFDGCSKMTEIEGMLYYLDTSEVTDMALMFGGCNLLGSLNVSNFKTEKVTNMTGMFSGCEKLTILDVSSLNTSKVENMTQMFDSCINLKSLDLSNFDTSNVEYMQFMFNGCWKLSCLNLSSFDTKKNTNTFYMFYDCRKLKSLDLSSFDMRAVTDMSYMFCYCSLLKDIYIGENFVTDNVKKYTRAFYYNYTNHAIHYPAGHYYDLIYGRNAFNGCKSMPYVPINADAEYGTLCVPVGSKLAAGTYSGFDKLYTVGAVDDARTTVTLTEATKIEPGVAYIYHRSLPADAAKSVISFTAEGNTVTAPDNDGRLLKGTFEAVAAPTGSYILQQDGMFHPVAAGSALQVGAYRAWLDLNTLGEGGAELSKALRITFGGSATGIGSVTAPRSLGGETVCYDLSGRGVTRPQRGRVYVRKGKKIIW